MRSVPASSGYGLVLMTLLVAVMRMGAAVPPSPVDLVGLTDDNRLLLFTSDRPGEVKRVAVSGIHGSLLGIDYRPRGVVKSRLQVKQAAGLAMASIITRRSILGRHKQK